MNEMSTTEHGELEKLMSDYVAFCNQVIAENCGRPGYRQAYRLGKALLGKTDFRVLIYDRNPNEPLAEYTLHFNPDRQALSLLPGGPRQAAMTWKTSLAYLRDVVQVRPQWYLEHPAMMDWNWMKNRLSDELERVDSRSLAVGFVLGTAATLLASAVLAGSRER